MGKAFSFKKKLNWKGIGYTVIIFLLAYYLPVTLAPKYFPADNFGTSFISVWLFAGLVILSGIASYKFSILVSESALAAIISLALGLILLWLFFNDPVTNLNLLFLTALIMACLAMFGSWIGNRFRVLQKKDKD